MRHTTATHGRHVSNQATKQVATNPHTQSSGQRRTGTSGRQPVLYGPELKIIHTARTRSKAAKTTQKHISEIIPATKVVQTAQTATATPQSPVKNQPRASTGVAQTTPQRPAHQPATPQKNNGTTSRHNTNCAHHQTSSASSGAAHHIISAQHAASATEAATSDDLATLGSANKTLIAPCANPTPHCAAYVHPAWRAT